MEPGLIAASERQALDAVHARYAPVNDRVAAILENIRCDCRLVAHYDTWRGPGADDNTTGEEILKQYLLADLRAARRPALTHTYFMAGSEEWAFDIAFDLSPRFEICYVSHTTVTLVAVVVTELAILLYLMTRRIPTWIDNGYRHENRADNLGSLKRVRP